MKILLSEHPNFKIAFYVEEKKFFGRGAKFSQPDFTEKIFKVEYQVGKIIVKGERHTRCSIFALDQKIDELFEKVSHYTGRPIGDIDLLEVCL